MAPILDFSDVPDFEPVPAGRYRAEVIKATEGESKSGQPKIDVQWKFIGGDNEGRMVFDTLSFHPNAAGFTKRKLLGMGFDRDFSGEVNAEDLQGITADLNVTIEQSEGTNPDTGETYEPRNRVTRIYQVSTSVGDLLGKKK